MLYEAIRLGCEKYHKNERAYDDAYADFFSDRNQSKWDNPDTLGNVEIRKLILFLDKFQAWGWPNVGKTTPSDFSALPLVLESLSPLKHKTLLDADFKDDNICKLISSNFVALQRCGPDNKSWSVAASKILHMINPELFLMWDNRIQNSYGWPDYTTRFLPKMQQIAEEAIDEIVLKENLSYEEATEQLESCNHVERIPPSPYFPNKVAKVLDEFNFMKYTRMTPAVWKTEHDL